MDVYREYFDWLCSLINNSRTNHHKQVLHKLYSTEFTYSIENDKNRASDGLDLRDKFLSKKYKGRKCIDIYGPCSVLEMMVALSIRCEDNIMYDPEQGDRTGVWFWDMIKNLGLNRFDDVSYDERVVNNIIIRFLSRDYKENGIGGLFSVPDCPLNFKEAEIWCQMCWYLDYILDILEN